MKKPTLHHGERRADTKGDGVLHSARPRGLTGVLGALLLCLSACRGGDEPPPGAVDEQPTQGGTVVIALGDEPETLIPYGAGGLTSTRVQSFLFRYLANTNADFASASPSLARSWEWSDDRLALTMHLRDDVFWTDGVQMTADDVRFSWEIGRDSTVAWRSRHWKERVLDCEVVDRFTVRYHFDGVFVDQFRYAREGFILPKHLLEDVPREQWTSSAYAQHPVGLGPFKLERWDRGQRIVLVRYDNYFESPKPYLERIVLEFVREPSTRVGRLRAGSVDYLPELPLRDAAELQKAFEAGQSPVRVVSVRGRGYDFIGYNPKNPLFSSPRVREALTRAVDRQAIVDALCHGYAEVFESPIVPILWAYDPTRAITPYDPDGARRLLAAEGWSDTDGDGWVERGGRRFEFTLMTNSETALRTQAIVPVQEYWRAVGVKANLRTLERATALELRGKRDFDAFYGGWNAGLSPGATILGLFGCDYVSTKNNFTEYCNAEVDSLAKLAYEMVDFEAARPLYSRIQERIVADHPYTWMYYEHDVVAYHERLRGILVDPRGRFLNMEDWYVPEALRTGMAGR